MRACDPDLVGELGHKCDRSFDAPRSTGVAQQAVREDGVVVRSPRIQCEALQPLEGGIGLRCAGGMRLRGEVVQRVPHRHQVFSLGQQRLLEWRESEKREDIAVLLQRAAAAREPVGGKPLGSVLT